MAAGAAGAGGAGAVPAALAPSGDGGRAGRAQRSRAGEIAAAAAEGRAREEDPEERRQRLAIAEHNKRQDLLGKVIGAHQALGEPVEVGMNIWSEQKLQQAYDRLLRRRRGSGEDADR